MSTQEMSKGLRDRIWTFFSFSYTHYGIENLLKAIKEEDLVDWNNPADTKVIGNLWYAHGFLQNAANATFGKHFLAEMDKNNRLTTD